jgi:hypothetical protein
VDALAAREVWKVWCSRSNGNRGNDFIIANGIRNFTPALEAYLDKFLLGKPDGQSTDILRSKYTDVDRAKWIPWTTPELK